MGGHNLRVRQEQHSRRERLAHTQVHNMDQGKWSPVAACTSQKFTIRKVKHTEVGERSQTNRKGSFKGFEG